ncbi:sulfotransferase family protein [Streptomonospora litoralis]|uniref:Sulfotransferase domain protein n=1 Tax=Streptomonospora litoralis TaxID=2498135 RepID=A0A4P6QAY8_9ACTN|nr:sulfotransferase [Streptomonospora litoralis]QBI56507.1 Sulfotransferase domain protein [Streptomonospora litoralis]
MNGMHTGFKRRARLLGEALRPPRSVLPERGKAERVAAPHAKAEAPGEPTATAAKPVPAKPTAAKAAKRPPKETVEFEFGVPIVARHVTSPVFVLSPIRSGSTLLRMLLNSHSRIRAPHELHLRTLEVQLLEGFSTTSMRELGLDRLELEHVLWDRLLHLEMGRSGKDVIVDKTPGNVWVWERLRHAWPQARFIFLVRHPEGIIASLADRKSNKSAREQLEANVLKYLEPLEKARTTLEGHFMRYEDLTADPEAAMQKLCMYLDVDWEPGMLDYGEHDHGKIAPNLGDRSTNIKTGRIQAPRELDSTQELPPELARYAELWGYA